MEIVPASRSPFWPPDRESVGEIGGTVHLSYRELSSVEYKLQINDSVRLPAACPFCESCETVTPHSQPRSRFARFLGILFLYSGRSSCY